ncbi:AtzG-like protein [Roseomonas marmotae]|uniref:DUF4089 domain-containing protein n=1 Tax=Roseomonas marmotae TaxID=2768161 RepID=A0ABS3KE56_9PROT|nr:AtzG-like protein [Roseomonas marmotae]MBO1074631.1 DUF4089 domain-containing protein [Roseomonas marmotae]QTI81652.1 DUF4089 domain-containing protein [Roseomonas marmotae]
MPDLEWNDRLEGQFRAMLALSGLTVPEDRLDAMRGAFAGCREMATVLAEPLPYEVEPAPAIPPYPVPAAEERR